MVVVVVAGVVHFVTGGLVGRGCGRVAGRVGGCVGSVCVIGSCDGCWYIGVGFVAGAAGVLPPSDE